MGTDDLFKKRRAIIFSRNAKINTGQAGGKCGCCRITCD